MQMIGDADNLIIAKEIGMRFPEYYKKTSQNIPEEIRNELYDASIYFFRKRPDAFEVSYLVYWNGTKFRGGYILYVNNHSMANRGYDVQFNGITAYPDDTPEIKSYMKRLKGYHKNPDSDFKLPKGWVMFNFLLYNDLLHYWGIEFAEDIDDLIFTPILNIEGSDENNFIEYLNSNESRKKPEVKYAAMLPVFFKDGIRYPICENADTVSKAWKNLYDSVTKLDKQYHVFLGIDEYHRQCHYHFRKSVDNYNEHGDIKTSLKNI